MNRESMHDSAYYYNTNKCLEQMRKQSFLPYIYFSCMITLTYNFVWNLVLTEYKWSQGFESPMHGTFYYGEIKLINW